MIWDFKSELDERGIELKLDYSWKGQIGFVVKLDDVLLVLDLITFFLDENNPEELVAKEKYFDKWYE